MEWIELTTPRFKREHKQLLDGRLSLIKEGKWKKKKKQKKEELSLVAKEYKGMVCEEDNHPMGHVEAGRKQPLQWSIQSDREKGRAKEGPWPLGTEVE